jgi:FMN-dependent oxidoreductase (nitrilotriacetate monooxygenase family)
MTRQMKLGTVCLHTGTHKGAWRDPRGQADAGVNFEHYVRVAEISERAKFDLLFLPDHSGIHNADRIERLRWNGNTIGGFEPMTLLSALAARTTHLGLIGTTSTSFDYPYNVARKFASLDLISGGRSGWNLVTSHNDAEAWNYDAAGLGAHADRYQRATEFADVVSGLWDSWDDDAFIRDTASGIYFDPSKVHALNHQGRFYRVRGPLNVPRSPQGRPLMVQAGSSDAGRELAARCAEVVFTAQRSLADAQEFYRDVKQRAAKYGRDPSEIVILPGLMTIVGRTEEEAKARDAFLRSLIHPDLALIYLSEWLGVDATKLPLDEPLPEIAVTEAHRSRQQMLIKVAKERNMTVRELAQFTAEGTGHNLAMGSPQQVADHLESWWREGAADGFAIIPPALPADLDDFVELVVPELQRRGIFRTEYEATTLRGNLGLPWPVSRNASARSAAE